MSSDDGFADSDVAEEEIDEVDESVPYEADEFDEYADSFESEGSESGGSRCAVDAPSELLALAAAGATSQFESGDRVQVLWDDENEWFDGKISRVDEAARPRAYYVQYDDGEAAWESGERMRYAPEVFGFDTQGFQQLQLLIDLPSMCLADGGGDATPTLLRSSVLVNWVDSASWFAGFVAKVDTTARALQIEYEDGDSRWEQERDFANILVRVPARSAPERARQANEAVPGTVQSQLPMPPRSQVESGFPTVRTQSLSLPPPPHHPERVLVPRAYKATVSDHFRPEITPRPYTSVTSTIGSVLTARTKCSERRYLQAKLECTWSVSRATADDGAARDCLVQTEIPTDSEGNRDSTRCMVCPRCGG